MRIRSIKPEFWSSEDIAALSFFDRLVFIGLWSMADDEGRLSGDVRLIRSQLFPLDDHITEDSVSTHGGLTEDSVSIHDTLMHLSNGGQITLYEGGNGRTYIQVNNFTEHQRINRPTASKYPAPTRENAITHGGLSEDSVSTHGGLSEDSVLEQGTGNREQGTGSRGVQGGDDSDEPHLPNVVADAPTTPAEAKPKRKVTGTRLPDGWFPSRTDANLRTERESGLNDRELQDALDNFRDYWAAQPGQRGRKADWDATWRNWVRRDSKQHHPRRQDQTTQILADAMARANAGINVFKEAS